MVSDKATGPRGDPVLSEQLKADITNLMLLCDKHHRQVDIADESGHPVDHLRGMKERHESRIELLGSLGPEKQSHVVLFGANIGTHEAALSINNRRQMESIGNLPAAEAERRYYTMLKQTAMVA